MVNQTQKKTTASSISEKSGITHLPNSQDEDETMPTTVDMVTAFLLETDRTMIDLRGKKVEADGFRLTSIVGLSGTSTDDVQEALRRVDGKVTKTFHKFVSRFGNPTNEPAQRIREIFNTSEYLAFVGEKSDDVTQRLRYLATLPDPSDEKGKRKLSGINALQKFADPPSPKLVLKRAAKARREYLQLSSEDQTEVDRMASDNSVDEKGQTKETALDVAMKSSGIWAIVPPKSAAK